jgi:N-methylhydantoinase A
MPGPVCYGRGATQPTVTDADLVLGYLDPDFFLGGTMRLDRDAAAAAISALGETIGLGTIETAWGIHQVVNEQMAGAARMHAVEQGKDPRDYPVFGFGGAGPVHAYRVAEILHAPELIVPLGAGVLSSLGFLVAPLAFDFVRSFVGRLDELDWDEVNARYSEMEAEGRAILGSAGADRAEITVSRTAELRYVGQGHQVTIPVALGDLSQQSAPVLAGTFEETYKRLYGRTATGNPLEAINWRVVTSASSPVLPLERLADSHPGGSLEDARKGSRSIYLPERNGFSEVPVFDRYRIGRGVRFEGPAVVEERESTTIIGDQASVAVDDLLNLIVTIPG